MLQPQVTIIIRSVHANTDQRVVFVYEQVTQTGRRASRFSSLSSGDYRRLGKIQWLPHTHTTRLSSLIFIIFTTTCPPRGVKKKNILRPTVGCRCRQQNKNRRKLEFQFFNFSTSLQIFICNLVTCMCSYEGGGETFQKERAMLLGHKVVTPSSHMCRGLADEKFRFLIFCCSSVYLHMQVIIDPCAEGHPILSIILSSAHLPPLRRER